MKKFFLLCLLCCLSAAMPLFSQEEEQEIPDETPEGVEGTDLDYVVRMNQRGDQYILFSLMVAVPLHPLPDKLYVGGEGVLGYMHFLNSWLAVGGTLDFGYHGTVGSNIFYYVPISARVTYQPTWRRMEFPLSLNLGIAFETYLNERMYVGMFIKPEAGVYFRFNDSWSFGGNVGLSIMPQWYENKANNYTGIVLDIGVSARYHF
jgi:hypothetical protein